MGSEIRKKTKIVRVRVTPEEWSEIENLAATCSLSAPEFMRRLALGYTPKSTLDADHLLVVAKLGADIGRIGGLLKLWLSTESIKNQAFALEVPHLVNELKTLQSKVKEEFKKL